MPEEDTAACNKAMASSQQNNYSSIPQQLPQAQATATGSVGGASQSMAPTAPDNTSAPAPAAADGANPGYYSAESIQQAVVATAALVETNAGSFGGGGSVAIQQSVQPGGVNTQVIPPTAAAPTIPAQYSAIGASASASASAPTTLATSPNEQLMALMAATAAMQQTQAQQQQPNQTIVAAAADQQQKFGLADQGSVIGAAVGFGDTMAPQIPKQTQQVQYERGSHVMESTTATMKDSEAPAPAAVVGGQQPTYVNAKQYKRILKRREERALIEEIYSIKRQRLQEQKASSNGRSEIDSSSGKRNQHESRRRHAKKRPRHKTGRFLTKTELVEYSKEHPEEDPKRLQNDGAEPVMEK